MDITLVGRVPVTALGDLQRFVEAAEHLKALTLQRQALLCRDSRRIAALTQQINAFTEHCGALAHGNPRVADLWTKTQDELAPLTPASPLLSESPLSTACSPGARGASISGKKGA